MPVMTGRVGVDETGAIWHLTPAGDVLLTPGGPAVTYGPPETLRANQELAPGVWQIIEGTVQASLGGATVRQVTIA